jgi:hypothetical protein
MTGRRPNPAAEFLSKVMGLEETPMGLVERAWVQEQMRSGSQAIQRCRNHRPPECQCWSASRAILWQARSGGDTSMGRSESVRTPGRVGAGYRPKQWHAHD